MNFPGFDAADFDAFVPKKQGSNAYTLERRRAKDKLLAVARALLERHPEAVEGLELETTEDAPSVQNGRRVRALSAFFVRPASVRSGLKELLATNLGAGAGLFEIAVHQQHAHLELRIDVQGLTVGVRVPPGARVDRENISEKLALDWAREDLAELLGALPAEARAGVEGELVAPSEVSVDAFVAWSRSDATTGPSLIVEQIISRDDPSLAEPAWLDTGVDTLASFAPVLRFLAWSKANDHTRVQEVVAKKVEATKKEAKGLEVGTRVTILSGLFSGRAGYVQELDHKGKAKVMVGPVTVTVDRDDLKPAG
jgi:hypothetical protein